MSVLRRRLRVPVTVLMLACNLVWSVPSYGDTSSTVNASTATKVLQITGAEGTANLRVGMLLEGNGFPVGTYITQILSGNQILVSQPVSASGNNIAVTFRDVEAVTETAGGNYTKTGTGLAILMNENLGGGLVQIQGGTLQLGGVNFQARSRMSGLLNDNTSIAFDSVNPSALNFATNSVNYLPFERVGSISGGGGNGVTSINLAADATTAVLAVGSNNSSTVYNGDIFGDAATMLIKEGTGSFTWNNNNATSMSGLMHVDSGALIIGGTEGLNDAVRLSLSNKADTRVELNTSNAEKISALSGGGRGAITTFSNGKLGALGGAYLNGGTPEVRLSGLSLTLENNTLNSFYSFGGAITGNGGFEKNGPNTLELLGNNTYTGNTSIVAGQTDNTNSILRLGAYGTSSGLGSLASSGFGSLPSTTRLILSAGSGGTNRNAIFDLNGATQTVDTLISVNASGSRNVLMRTGTLNINTQSGSDSSNFNGTFVGRGTINVLNTQGSNGWTLSGDSNTAQTGALNILAGRVTLNRSGGALGDAVHVTVNNGGTLAVSQSDTIGSLSGNGTVSIDSSRFLTLSAAPAGGIMNSSWSGNITGSGGLELGAGASLRLTTAQNYLGGTRLNSGSALYLDYGTGSTSTALIPGTFILRGGSVFMTGTNGQTVANTTIEAGATNFYTDYNSTAAIGLVNITRNGGGVINVHGNALSIDRPNVNGIVGGYATHLSLDANGKPKVTWAVANGTAPVTGLSTFETNFNLAGGLSGKNMLVDAAAAVASGTTAISGALGSLYFSEPVALTLNIGGADGLSRTMIESGGILVSPEVGPNNLTIKGKVSGTEITGGVANTYGITDELIVHQYNARGSLTIDASIVDNSNNTRLTKAGPGTLILTRPNSYTGQTSILGGVLELASANSTEFGTLGNSSADIINHGYLKFNLNLAEGAAYNVDNSITGTGTIRKDNASSGLVILRGSNNTYTGPTQVLAGTLGIANSNTGLGSVAGLTTVSQGATLQLRAVGGAGVPVLETVVLEGGALSSAVGASNLGGALILTKDSTVHTDGPDSPLTLSGTIFTYPGVKLNVASSTPGGLVILTNTLNQLGDISVGDGAGLQIGGATVGGYVGHGVITTGAGSRVITNTNNGHMALSAKITGAADFYQVRNTVYLTADNDYTGKTYVGGNGTIGFENSPAELRVGIGGYTGNVGTGDIIIQSNSLNNSGTSTWVRVDVLRDLVWNNRIEIYPSTPGTNSNSPISGIIRYGVGSLTLNGPIVAGVHTIGDSTTSAASLRTSSGGKLIISGQITNGADSRLDLTNDGIMVFSGSNDQTLWGIMSSGTSATSPTSSAFIFKSDGTIRLKGNNTALSNHFIQKGTVIIDNDDGQGIADNADYYLSNGATLQFNYNETMGVLGGMKGSNIILNQGSTLTLNDAVTMGIHSNISGDGSLNISASSGSGTFWYGLFGNNSFTSDMSIGASGQTITVRANNLTNAGEVSSLGMGDVINLGGASGVGDSRLEYIGAGQETDRDINITGGGGNVVRIAGSGRGALILNGDIKVTGAGNKTLHLHGQTNGNTVNGVIDENGQGALSLIINSAAGNNDMYGQGRWILSNDNNNFSGNVTVNLGVLELAGSLGDGGGTTSVLGDLTKNRVISLGTGNFDGRKFDVFSGGDNLGAASGLGSTGSLVFNDAEDGVATLGANISFKQEYDSTSNPGWGEIVNNGNKVVVLEGAFTVGSTGARNWVLDGSNAGTTVLGTYIPNTIKGSISDTSNTGNVVSLLKEGAGVWRLSGANTYEGTTTITRGTLELFGGLAIQDNGIINLSNAGSDGSSAEAATLRVLSSETIGGLQGAVGSQVEIAAGQSLTVRGTGQTFNGVISGDGGFVRTNSSSTAVDTTFTNNHTYTGATVINTTGGNSGAPRINVLFLANGGEASGLGASSSAAQNLVLNTGSVAGGLRWIGANDQSTDRLFTIGVGTSTIWAEGQVFGNNVPTISFTNTGALAFTGTGNRALTLRGPNRGDNYFAPSITDGGSGVTSLNKNDVGTWVLSGNNTFTGKVTITGGTLAITSNTALGSSAGGVEISLATNSSTSYLDLRGVTVTGEALTLSGSNTSFFGLSASEGTNVWTGTIANNSAALLNVGLGASLNLQGVISGSSTLTKVGNGTLTLSASNTRTGAFLVRGGKLVLDFSTNNTSKLSDTSSLTLGSSTSIGFFRGPNDTNRGQEYLFSGTGATIDLAGGSHVEVVLSTTLEAGASSITRSSGTSVLRMNTVTRSANSGGTLDFGAVGIAQVDNTNSNGILGGWATVAKTDWATNSTNAGDGAIGALATYGTTWASGVNTNITTNLSASGVTNTVRFNSATSAAVNLTAAGTITTGGILVTPNVGANNVFINNSTLTATSTDIVVHQHNALGSLTINSQIIGSIGLTKSGVGDLYILGNNTNTGTTYVNEGRLFVGNGGATGQLGTGAGAILLNGSLIFNSTQGTEFVQSGSLRGNGDFVLADTNTRTIQLTADNVNFTGRFIVNGGVLASGTNGNSLGSSRITTIVNNTGTLELRGMSQGISVFLNDSGRLRSGVGSNTVSGTLNITGSDTQVEVNTGSTLTLSGLIYSTSGMNKYGNGLLNITANQFQNFLDGAAAGSTTANANASFLGQFRIMAGEVRIGNLRALGGTGVGNETIIASGASLDLRGNSLNWADDDVSNGREIIQVSGEGFNGLGALKNSTGTGTVSTIVFDADATLSGGGFANGSRLILAGYDINPNTGSNFTGNFTRGEAEIYGNNANLTIIGNSTLNDGNGTGVTFRDPKFMSALNSILVKEGNFRIEMEANREGATFSGVTSANVTNGITVAYSGATLADYTNASLGVGPNVGARLNFYRNWNTDHSVSIVMDGVTAKANAGANYIDLGADSTTPNPRTYLSGDILLLGDADRNFFHIDASNGQQTIGDQGNQTGAIQSKLIVNGVISGDGGFTKTGLRELRLTNNNTFTGAMNILRFATAAVPWQDNLVTINGIDYQTYGDAEAWAEWGVTLSGLNGAVSGTSAINLQRRGLLVLDNTTRLDQTSDLAHINGESSVFGGYNGDRINDAASINFNHGWLKIFGNSDVQIQNENLATAGGARVNVLSGTNILDLIPADGANTSMRVTIGEISRSAGSVLQINALDSTTRFSSNYNPSSPTDTVGVYLNSIGTLTQVGGSTVAGTQNKSVIIGLFGGIMPHEYLSDVRQLAYNNGGASDYLNQGRNQQYITAGHFMTYDPATKLLRPLDDSEYFMPSDGMIDTLNGSSGKNINLMDNYTVVRQNTTINALRFGPLSDVNGSGGAINTTTTLTDLPDGQAIQLYVNGTLRISSGMISSANFATANTNNLATYIMGGVLNFGSREAIINNQNTLVRASDGVVTTGNLEIRSSIAGTGGLLKTGLAQVILDGFNTYSGVTTVSNGNLYLRNGRQALGVSGPGNGVVIEGNGNLFSDQGIQIGRADAYEDVLVKALQGNQSVFRVSQDVTNWFGNLIIDNVDVAGQTLFTPIVRLDNSASTIMNGDIYGGSSAVTNDVVAIDSRIVQFEGAGSNNYIFRGQFGDRADANGNATSIANTISTLPTLVGVRTNENEVLRVNFAGAADTNYILEQQYNAVGRLTLVQGTMLVNYDPNDPLRDGNGFWTDSAISKMPGASSANSFALNGNTTHHGFTMGTSSNGSSSLFLTRDGQNFNMSTWSTTGSGLKFVGGINESGTVSFGTPSATGTLTASGNSGLRLYAAPGGTVVFDQVLLGAPGTAPNNVGFTKAGRGTVVLRNSTSTTAATGTFELAGGKLVLDYSSGMNTAMFSNSHAAFGGGTVEGNANANDPSFINFASATNAILQLRMGTTELVAKGIGDNWMAFNLGNAGTTTSATLTREQGAVVNFVDAGLGIFSLNFNAATIASNQIAKNAVIPWATYSDTVREADDFAMVTATGNPTVSFTATTTSGNANLTNVTNTDALTVGMTVSGAGIPTGTTITRIAGTTVVLSATTTANGTNITLSATMDNRVNTFARAAGDYQNNVAAWTAGQNISETSGGVFTGALASDLNLTTLRFDSAQNSTVTINTGRTLRIGNSVAGGLLVSSNTGTANKTITGGSLTTANSAPELILHQYGKGILTINSVITGSIGLTIAGPSSTSPDTLGTTGIVRLTANNTYTGSTNILGAALEISNVLALGPNPSSVAASQIKLDGGTLRWTGDVGALGNRGILIDGNGGVIDVVNPAGNLVVGTALVGTSATVTSEEIYGGDLIKTGAGALTMLGNSGLQGLLDVRQGSLILMKDNGDAAAGTTTVLGTSRSVADGTIMRSGTNIQVFLGNVDPADGGDWNIEEYFTFEGGNTFTYGGFHDVSTNLLETISTDQVQIFNLGSRRPLNLNGVIDIKGTTTFDVTFGGTLRLNNNAGYLSGSGDIVKDGLGSLHFRANEAEWKGNLIVKQGTVYAGSQADVLGTGYLSGKTITLGDTERQGSAELLINNAESVNGWVYEINHDINVVYNPAQTKRLGSENIMNGDTVSYNGDITLNDSLILLIRDTGLAVGGEQSYVNFNGSFKDGAVTSGNLVVQADDNNTGLNDQVANRMYGYAVLNGDNSAWTGDISISTNVANGTNSGYNQDVTTILRLGHSKALTAANDVTMNYNSILQAGGQNVTIGNLLTKGGDGQFYGDSGTISASGTAGATNGSSEIIENASATAANLTIAQTTPVTYEASWDAFFRDGTLNSTFGAPGANILQPSAALSITKTGAGWATLTLDNDYTGTTYVDAGVLQVGRNGVGDTGAVTAMGTIVKSGGTLAGSGTVQGRLSILSGGMLKTGDSAGQDIGTLTVNGDVLFATGSQALMQVRAASYNNPGALMESDQQYDAWLSRIVTANDAFSNALNDLVTTFQHDMVSSTGSILLSGGSKITLQSDGYTPKAGDVFTLFRGNSYAGNLNVGNARRYGGETDATLDLILFALGGNLMWDVSLFNQYGILVVVEGDVQAQTFDPPVITQQPTSNQSQTEQLDPGVSVTLTAAATGPTNAGDVSYQWLRNGIPVDSSQAKKASYTFVSSYETKGVYTVAATNKGGTTISSGSATVLVKDLPDITVGPSSVTVDPGATHVFNVSAGGEAPLYYQWFKNGAAVGPATTTSSLTLTEITEDDEGSYYVVVSNDAGTDTSTAVTLTVRDPVSNIVVTMNPTETYAGQDIQFAVTHAGDGPFTYQWLRDGVTISGATKSSFILKNAQQTSPETISVRITAPNNINYESDALPLVLRPADPVIVTASLSQTVLSGSLLDLKVVATGRPVLNYLWKKDGKALATAVTPDISKIATLTDGGNYTVDVTNTANKDSVPATDPIIVVVVDGAQRLLPVPLGQTASFTANVSANKRTPLTYEWQRVTVEEGIIDPGEDEIEGTEDDVFGDIETLTPMAADPADPTRITGINTKVMKIARTTTADLGLYRCTVTGPGGAVTGCQYELRLYTTAPEFDAGSPDVDIVNKTIAFPSGTVGRQYTFELPINHSDITKTPDKIAVSGLPSGLKADPVSGIITGVPVAARVGGYPVTVTLSNRYGKIAYRGNIQIDALSDMVVGTWVATVDRDPAIGGNLGGRVDLTVTTQATYSGKLTLAGAAYSFKGSLDMEGINPKGSVVIRPKGAAALTLNFEINQGNNTFRSGSVTDGNSTVNFQGWRKVFSKLVTAQTYTGYYTMAIGLDPQVLPPDDQPENGSPIASGDPDLPLGVGYATFTVAVDGSVKIAGLMPDGEKISMSTFIGPNGEIGVYQFMYKALRPGGSIHGLMDIDDQGDAVSADPTNSLNTLTGDATWVRPAATKAGARYFAKGFGIIGAPYGLPVELIVRGGRYDPPAVDMAVLGIDPPNVGEAPVNNSRIEFTHGGDIRYVYSIGNQPFVSRNPNADFAVTLNSKILMLDPINNVAKTSVKAAPKTGIVTGAFDARDYNPRFPEIKPDIVIRKVKFQGVIIKEGGESIAVGYFMLPQLPANRTDTEAATTTTTSPYFSGRFEFFKNP